MIIVKNKETGKISIFKNVDSILKNINRDRSKDWTPYNKNDWREGLEEFTEYTIIKVIKGV